MAFREIARRSLLHAMLRLTIPATVLVALACLSALVPSGLRGDGRRSLTAGRILIAAFTLGIAIQMNVGARLQSDGFYYYAYLRSLAFDGDVDFTNDYRMLGMGDKAHLFKPTPTGHAQSAWTIGPAIVWSPFFGVGHIVATRLHAKGVDVAIDGTSFPYRQAVCVAGLFYGLLGCWFIYRLARRFYAGPVAVSAVVLVICGSFMLWYFVKEPTMTHAPSMAAVAAFVWLWAGTRERRTMGMWALLGALAGLMALIRWQNALFMLLPGIDFLRAPARRDVVTGSIVFLGCALLAFVPQMLAWKAIYGSYVARSPVGPEIRWSDPHLVDILFSARNGLFSTTPILYLGAVGLIVFAVARPAIGMPALAAVAVMLYFNACIQDWWGSAGFGGRRFDGTIPLFAIGLAALIDSGATLVRRHAVAAVTAALALLALWNVAMIGAAQQGAVRIGETLAFDRAWSAQARVFHGWFGNPFTYPASLFFAASNAVSPGDYDLLATDRLLGDPLRPYGRVDIGGEDAWLLEDGWHGAETEGAVSFRWAQRRATVRLPLDHAAPLHVQVRLHAFAYPGAPQQTLTVSANGHPCAPQPVAPDWQTAECTLDAAAWRSGVNRVQLAFGYGARPMDVGLGGDSRELAAAVDWIRVSVAER